jgi:hypothetical protein
MCRTPLLSERSRVVSKSTEERSSRGREKTRSYREARRRDSRGGRETGGPEDGTKKALATDVIPEECGKHGRKPAGLAGRRDDEVVVWKPNQTFEKSGREGDNSQEKSPFRFFTRLAPALSDATERHAVYGLLTKVKAAGAH